MARPSTWDDTGITAGAVFISTLSWAWALAVGGWIPALGIVRHGNYASLLALVVAFAGAYAGVLGRKAIGTLIHTGTGSHPQP